MKRLLLPGKHFFAFLTDVCVVCMPERTRTVHDLLVWRERGFDSTLETRGCGTKQESAPQEWDFPLEVRSPQGMKILRTPVGTEAFKNVACGERIEEEERSCGTPSIESQTCSALGRCWSSVFVSGATINCVPCFHHVLSRTRKPTTQACNVQCCPFLVSCLGAPSNKRWRGSWPHCHCALGFWASEKWLRETSEMNCSITSKTGTTRTPTSRPQSTTPMTTLTSTIAWRTCTESARTAHLFHSCDCLTLHIFWLKF